MYLDPFKDRPTIEGIFTAMSNDVNLFSLLPDTSLRQLYLFLRSYKLIDSNNFSRYCRHCQILDNNFNNTLRNIGTNVDTASIHLDIASNGYTYLYNYIDIATPILSPKFEVI